MLKIQIFGFLKRNLIWIIVVIFLLSYIIFSTITKNNKTNLESTVDSLTWVLKYKETIYKSKQKEIDSLLLSNTELFLQNKKIDSLRNLDKQEYEKTIAGIKYRTSEQLDSTISAAIAKWQKSFKK
jgi:hypothetical protein